MGTRVVDNHVHAQVGTWLSVKLGGEPNEIPVALSDKLLADDSAVEPFWRFVRHRRWMPLIAVGLTGRNSWVQRQLESHSVRGLNLALLLG
jgi:hypothetical protein